MSRFVLLSALMLACGGPPRVAPATAPAAPRVGCPAGSAYNGEFCTRPVAVACPSDTERAADGVCVAIAPKPQPARPDDRDRSPGPAQEPSDLAAARERFQRAVDALDSAGFNEPRMEFTTRTKIGGVGRVP